jgi:hypothetical protein
MAEVGVVVQVLLVKMRLMQTQLALVAQDLIGNH